VDGVDDGLNERDPAGDDCCFGQVPEEGNSGGGGGKVLEGEEDDVEFLLDFIGKSGDDDSGLNGHGWVDGGVGISSCVPERNLLSHPFITELRAECVFPGLGRLA